jgi:hypothetical protein
VGPGSAQGGLAHSEGRDRCWDEAFGKAKWYAVAAARFCLLAMAWKRRVHWGSRCAYPRSPPQKVFLSLSELLVGSKEVTDARQATRKRARGKFVMVDGRQASRQQIRSPRLVNPDCDPAIASLPIAIEGGVLIVAARRMMLQASRMIRSGNSLPLERWIEVDL